MMVRRNDLRIFNKETGEIITEGYSIRSVKQDEAYANLHRAKSREFTASDLDNLHEVYSVLTTAQSGYLLRLQCNVGYSSGLLVNNDREKTPMSKADMMDELGLSKKTQTFYDFFNACLTNGIIFELGDETYTVNTRYHFRGAFEGRNVVRTYTTMFKRAYSEIKATDLGLIYRMLPYIHYDTNALCKNPNEQNASKIEWLSVKELAELIGVKRNTLSQRLSALEFDGQYVILRSKLGKDPTMLTFNPYVFYRKGTPVDGHLKALFQRKDGR